MINKNSIVRIKAGTNIKGEQSCQQQAKHLPLKERAILIRTLINDLDELDEKNLEQLWIKEASKRFQEFKAGNFKARLGNDVFRDARTKLNKLK